MEGSLICLDTSVLIDYFRKKTKQKTYFFLLAEKHKRFAVTSITTFEIYRGLTSKQDAFWEEVFAQMEILPLDEGAAKTASALFQKMNAKTKLIALPDLLIASIAVFNDVPLATLNKKDFERVPSLQLV